MELKLVYEGLMRNKIVVLCLKETPHKLRINHKKKTELYNGFI